MAGNKKYKGEIDFVVENNPVTEEDKKLVSSVIAHYKQTGRKKILPGGKKRPVIKKHLRKPGAVKLLG